MELEIRTLEDLKKLGGWQIKKAEFKSGIATLELTLSHIAAEKSVVFEVSGTIQSQLGIEGVVAVFKAVPALTMRSKDAEGA